MYNLIHTKKFDNYDFHNEKLSKLFLQEEHKFKPPATKYDRMSGYQAYNDVYNIFQWKYTSIIWLGYNIYNFIKETFNIETIDDYFIHGWFNVLDSDEFLHWHTHFKRFGECRKQEGIFTVSGHYMVDAENSATIYRDNNEKFSVPTENGMCTIFDSKLEHKSDFKKDGLRTSIAFDIIPKRECTKRKSVRKTLCKLGDIK